LGESKTTEHFGERPIDKFPRTGVRDPELASSQGPAFASVIVPVLLERRKKESSLSCSVFLEFLADAKQVVITRADFVSLVFAALFIPVMLIPRPREKHL
jgi:hypothetical protein